MKKIRVLHLRKSEGFYGAEKIILSLVEEIDSSIFETTIGCLNDVRKPCLDLAFEARQGNINTEVITCRSRFDLQTILKIISIVRRKKIDILHCHGFKADIYGWFAARWTDCYLMTTKHGWTHANRLVRLWEWMDLIFLRSFDKIVAVSDQIAQELLKKHISQDRIHRIPNGTPIYDNNKLDQSSLRKEMGFKREDRIVGIVGRLSIEKGHRFFLEAAKSILNKFPSTKFLIVGEGNLYAELKNQAFSLGLKENVFFTGFRKDVALLYRTMDVVVSSSLREGIPMTILESMAVGKPVVATSVGGVTKLVQNNRTGFLIPPRDADAIAKKVIKMLGDKKLMKNMGHEGKKFVRDHFSSKKMAEAYSVLYRDILAERSLEYNHHN